MATKQESPSPKANETDALADWLDESIISQPVKPRMLRITDNSDSRKKAKANTDEKKQDDIINPS